MQNNNNNSNNDNSNNNNNNDNNNYKNKKLKNVFKLEDMINMNISSFVYRVNSEIGITITTKM